MKKLVAFTLSCIMCCSSFGDLTPEQCNGLQAGISWYTQVNSHLVFEILQAHDDANDIGNQFVGLQMAHQIAIMGGAGPEIIAAIETAIEAKIAEFNAALQVVEDLQGQQRDCAIRLGELQAMYNSGC
jgi:hypothetical protein